MSLKLHIFPTAKCDFVLFYKIPTFFFSDAIDMGLTLFERFIAPILIKIFFFSFLGMADCKMETVGLIDKSSGMKNHKIHLFAPLA